MGLLELLVEVRSGVSYVLVLPDYASEKHSASAELASFCESEIRWIILLGKRFFADLSQSVAV